MERITREIKCGPSVLSVSCALQDIAAEAGYHPTLAITNTSEGYVLVVQWNEGAVFGRDDSTDLPGD